MEIAIRGHKSRGKEVIQILESLGGVNACPLKGTSVISHYYIDYNFNNSIHCHDIEYINKCCKKYTLEEFEKEFPFKIGELCIYSSDIIGEDIVVRILGMTIENDCIMYEVGHRDIAKGHSYIYKKRETLRPYKEMNTRNVTLTLEKAKEWYKKGGELKEIALQAFTEKELNPLPKTWKEFCENYPVQERECWLGSCGEIYEKLFDKERIYKNWIPSRKSAEAHLAMMQLEQLRDCYRGLFITVMGMPIWNISIYDGKPHIFKAMWGKNQSFLSFQSKEVAEEYLKNFKPLIEQAGDLI